LRLHWWQILLWNVMEIFRAFVLHQVRLGVLSRIKLILLDYLLCLLYNSYRLHWWYVSSDRWTMIFKPSSEWLKHVCLINLLKFNLCKLFNKLINFHKTTSNSDADLISILNLDKYALFTKFIDLFRFSDKHDMKLLSILKVI